MTRTQRQIENFRKGTALIQVWDSMGRVCAGIHVSVEQETHEFLFGCVVPDLSLFSDSERHRYNLRLHEVFNRVRDANQTQSAGPDTLIVDASNREGKLNRIHLGGLRSNLDRLSSSGEGLEVLVFGRTVGCGLLKRNLSPKHAYKILRKLIGTIWHSRANGETNSHGLFQFRGFFGNYRVVVSVGKTNATIKMLTLSRNDDRSTPLVIEIPDV